MYAIQMGERNSEQVSSLHAAGSRVETGNAIIYVHVQRLAVASPLRSGRCVGCMALDLFGHRTTVLETNIVYIVLFTARTWIMDIDITIHFTRPLAARFDHKTFFVHRGEIKRRRHMFATWS